MRLFKVLGTTRQPFHGGAGQWPYPGWLEVEGDLEPCLNGLHLCREGDLAEWLGPEIWEAEHEGELIEHGDKVVVRRARLLKRLNWDDRVARLFACDCAERVLGDGADPRSTDAVRVARLFANGDTTADELTAARAAAGAAARAAARAAAGAAARAAAGAAAWDAAGAAARAAARAASWDASWAAAGAAEREWQAGRLAWYLDGEGE